jgi:hypothetical protein
MVIALFWQEFEAWQGALPPSVTSTARELEQPSGAGRAVQLDLATPGRLVQVTIWESGDVDLIMGDLSTGEILANEHREVTTRIGLRGLLGDVSEAIS